MALDRALIRSRQTMAAALETDTGSPATLNAAAGAFNAWNHRFAPSIGVLPRELQGSMSPRKAAVGARMGTHSFTMDLHGNGASGLPLWATTLLSAAGFTVSSTTYSPDSTHDITITTGFYDDGRLFTLTGAKTDFTMRGTAGQPVEVDWTVTGKFPEPTAVALITPTHPTVQPPRLASGTFTVGGANYFVEGFSLSSGNSIVMRQSIHTNDDATRSGDGTGYHAAAITGRNLRFTIQPEASVFATKNWYQDLLDADTLALNLIIGATANNIITIAAPALQLMTAAPGSRDDLSTDVLEFACMRSAATGDDELTINLT